MHIFYEAMQLTAVATRDSVRLMTQIPLRTEQSTYAIYEAIPILTFQPEIQNFMQIGRTSEWFTISADYRNYMKLDFDYTTYCRPRHITFCDFKNAIFDGSFECCVGGLFFGKPDVALRYCERLIVGHNSEP